MKRKLLIVLAALVVVGALAFFFVLPALVERRLNAVRQSPPYAASERARSLHRTLTVADRWPVSTWRSLKERALYQARKLQDTAARSGGRFVVIRTRGDLAQFLERRKSDPQLVAGLLG